jgi:hypothetical protein
MIFGMFKRLTKLDIYFVVYVGVVFRRESNYINGVWIVMCTALYVKTRLKMTSTSFSTTLKLMNASRLLVYYLSLKIKCISRALTLIECLRCTEMKIEPLWVELQHFFLEHMTSPKQRSLEWRSQLTDPSRPNCIRRKDQLVCCSSYEAWWKP